MAVAVIVGVPGGNEQLYEQLKLFPEGKLPDGWLIHLACPTEKGRRVVNIVPSQEQFEAFEHEPLAPAAQQGGDPPPEITFFPCLQADPELTPPRCQDPRQNWPGIAAWVSRRQDLDDWLVRSPLVDQKIRGSS